MQPNTGGFLHLPAKGFLRAVAFGLLLSTAPVLSVGCYGKFPLTKTIYHFNGSVTHNKFWQSVLFWVFLIIPVYKVAMLGDAIIFNLIEFWTGASLNVSVVTDQDGKTVALVPSEDGREVTLTVSEQGKVLSQTHIVKTSDTTFEIRDNAGQVTAGVVRTPSGDLLLNNAEGVTLKRLPANEIAAALAR
ncbi:MAG: DUF3332 family protein [bacterium]